MPGAYVRLIPTHACEVGAAPSSCGIPLRPELHELVPWPFLSRPSQAILRLGHRSGFWEHRAAPQEGSNLGPVGPTCPRPGPPSLRTWHIPPCGQQVTSSRTHLCRRGERAFSKGKLGAPLCLPSQGRRQVRSPPLCLCEPFATRRNQSKHTCGVDSAHRPLVSKLFSNRVVPKGTHCPLGAKICENVSGGCQRGGRCLGS